MRWDELHREALKRIARSGENDYRRYLLAECLEAYAELDEAEKGRLQALLGTAQYQEVRPLMITTYERGMEQGIEQGIERGIVEGERRSALRQLEVRFGPLAPEVNQRVQAMAPEGLAQLQIDLLQAQSLRELGLEG